MKICSKCGEEKELTDFYKCKDSKDELTYWCKECLKKSARKWAEDNPEKNKVRTRNYYRNHPGCAVEHSKKWRDANLEQVREISRSWKRDNPEKHRSWNVNNPEKVRTSRKKYFHERRLKLKETDITFEFLFELKEDSTYCPLCEKEMIEINLPFHPDQKQLDHIVPLSIGGTHTKDNVRYICGSCNNHRPRLGQDLAS